MYTAKKCTRHESQKGRVKYCTDKHPQTFFLKTRIGSGDSEDETWLRITLVSVGIISKKQCTSTSNMVKKKLINKAYVLQPAAGKHGHQNVQRKPHCGQYLQFQTWKTEVGEHRLKVCLGYIVRLCLKSQNRKENQKERKEVQEKQSVCKL